MRLAFRLFVLTVLACSPGFCNSANAQLFAENANRLDAFILNLPRPVRCQPPGTFANGNWRLELPTVDKFIADVARSQEEFGRRLSKKTGMPTLRELLPFLDPASRDGSLNRCLPCDEVRAEAAPPLPESKFAAHPLSPAIEIAEKGLTRIRNEIFDYTATLVKRERINGSLQRTEYLRIKVRQAREINGEKTPFSVYMRFLKPADKRGQEVIWVEGRNQGKLIAHGNPGTSLGRITLRLDPDSSLAMYGNKFPIYEAGIERLVVKLIEKASRDRETGDCIVNFSEEAQINKRPCSVIELVHPEKREPYEFHKAKVYIDKELNLPVRYASWDWPLQEDEKPPLLEEYTYVDVKLNVGLTDEDFNYRNPEYDYR